MKRLKVCIVTQDIYTLGGVQKTVYNICSELVDNDDVDIKILMSDKYEDRECYPHNSKLTVEKISHVYSEEKSLMFKVLNRFNNHWKFLDNAMGAVLVSKIMFNKSDLVKLATWINAECFDVVIGAGVKYSLLLGFVSNQIKAKKIGWMHSTYNGYFKTKNQNLWGYETLSIKMLEKLDRIFVLNQKDKLEFEKRMRTKCEVLYNPIRLTEYREKHPRKEYDLIFSGRLNMEVKGLDLLLDIVNRVCKAIPNVKCAIVGDGKDEAQFKRKIDEKNLRENIMCVGFQNDVTPFYEKSRLLISTSRWEGFGLSIVEAMTCGVPCVAFDNDGPSEIIESGVDGILVERYNSDAFAQCIINCLTNRELLDKLSQNALTKSKKFSPDKVAKRFVKLVGDVCFE